MRCGRSPTETPRKVGGGESGSRRRRARRTGAGPRCGSPRALSLLRSRRAVRAHGEDSQGCYAAVAPRRPFGGLTVGKAAAAGDGPGAPARARAAAVRGRSPCGDPCVQSEPTGRAARDAERQ